ncbi:alpha/beta hydrolase [Candidatus Kaiserbacteria bacterium]|nr:alpha/beta hydrolase [Candidatus Kaiserbacteria bacterium]
MKVIVQNLATEYKDEGSGSAFLLLHGWQDSLNTFDELAERLKGKYRIVRLDMPGFGQTEPPKTAWELQNYVDFVSAFIEKLGLDVAYIGGHSFGGRVAIKGIAMGVFSPEKVVLMDTAGFVKNTTAKNRFITLLAKAGKKFVPERLKKKLYERIGSDYYAAGALKETFVKVINEDLSEYATQIQIPTLLIWGEDDTATPLADGKRFNELIRGSELKVIEDAGHFVHREKPESVAEYIERFL